MWFASGASTLQLMTSAWYPVCTPSSPYNAYMNPADSRPLAIFLMGPTASGKTALACEMAERFALGLISVDSALVYRGMDIGTAKPDAATRARYPHALIDIREPRHSYSAAQFASDAKDEMARISATGAIPLLIGGTSLYYRALQYGLSPMPAADPDIREQLAQRAAESGWPALHAELEKRDPASAARIKPGDSQRIQRALEVIELTGRPFSAQQSGHPYSFGYRVLKLALVPERALLHQRIEQRFDIMIESGFLDEVRALQQRGDLEPELSSMRAVGYRQAWQYLNGAIDRDQFRDTALAATRQLAKRQITWLRSTLDARWLGGDGAGETALRAVGDFLG